MVLEFNFKFLRDMKNFVLNGLVLLMAVMVGTGAWGQRDDLTDIVYDGMVVGNGAMAGNGMMDGNGAMVGNGVMDGNGAVVGNGMMDGNGAKAGNGAKTGECNRVVAYNGAKDSVSTDIMLMEFSRYNVSEIILDASEIGGPMLIDTISFHLAGPSGMTHKTNVTVWIQPTNKTFFANVGDTVLLDTSVAVQVYSGNMNCSPGWNDFALTVPYDYDGSTNLLVIVDDNSNALGYGDFGFSAVGHTGNKTLFFNSLSADIDPRNIAMVNILGWARSTSPWIRLKGCEQGTCDAPSGLVVSDVTYQGATLTWNGSNSSGATYTVYADHDVMATGLTDTSYTFTGLSPAKCHTLGVRAVCSAANASVISRTDMSTMLMPMWCGSEASVVAANSDDADTLTDVFPARSGSPYGYTEVIVPAGRLTGLNEIRALDFKPIEWDPGAAYLTGCSVYLMHTTATSLGSGFIHDTANMQLVYTGSLEYSDTMWRRVYFDNHFFWNGTDNVLVAIYHSSTEYTGDVKVASYVASGTPARYFYDDESFDGDIATTDGTATNIVPWYRLVGCPTGSSPCVYNVVSTGDSTGIDYRFPVNNYYRYSLTETLIEVDEIGGPMRIDTISYQYSGDYPTTGKNNVSIWLQPTTKTSFAGMTDFEPLNPLVAERVYHGPLNCSWGWNDFPLCLSYYFDGTTNLMVIVIDSSGSYAGPSFTFNIVDCPEAMTYTKYSDVNHPSLTDIVDNGVDKTVHTSRAVMALKGCDLATCHVPIGASVSDVTYESATLSWSPGAEAGATYRLYCNDSVVATGISDTSYTFTGLMPESLNILGVQSICSADDSSTVVYVRVRTPRGPVFCGTELAGVWANADTINEINGFFPGSSYFNYSYVEVIIPAERLTGLCEIKGFEFKPIAVNEGSSYFNNCEVYMMHTTATSLVDGFLANGSNMTLVLSDTLNFTDTTWQQFAFDRSFYWNGHDNVVIAVLRNEGSWDTRNYFAAYSPCDSLARYKETDDYVISLDDDDLNLFSRISGSVPLIHLLGCEPEPINVSVEVSNSVMGTTTPAPGEYTYEIGDTMSFTALPNPGYHFDCWEMEVNGAMLAYYSTDFTYVLPPDMTGAEVVLEAVFAPNQYNITVEVNDTTLGSATGGGTYDYMDTVTLRALPAEGGYFTQWDDGDGHARRDVVVAGHATYTAIFSDQPVASRLTVTVAPAEGGHVLINGSEAGIYEGMEGETVTLTAVVNDGYHFNYWEGVDGADSSETITFELIQPVYDIVCHMGSDVGIGEAEEEGAIIYSQGRSIVVRGAGEEPVRVFDIMGRLVAQRRNAADPEVLSVPATGVYMVKVGERGARKVVVMN